MEKTEQKTESTPPPPPKHVIWDCGSSLYDSFELKSFEKQLDSAIVSRTLSMPHLSDHRRGLPSNKKPTSSSSKISRSIQRFIRAVFKPKNNNSIKELSGEEGFYDQRSSAALWTIPEVSEFDGFLSPELRTSLVRRTASDRFTTTVYST